MFSTRITSLARFQPIFVTIVIVRVEKGKRRNKTKQKNWHSLMFLLDKIFK